MHIYLILCFNYVTSIIFFQIKLYVSFEKNTPFLQGELFGKFLHGSTLEECYSAVASVADGWLDLLDVCKTCLLG